MNFIKVCSLDDWESVDGLGGEKEDSRTNKFKKEDCVLGFGPTGLEIIVMYQLWWWVSCYVVPDSCDPVDCSLPGASVHRFLQARILEWVAISFPAGSQHTKSLKS